MKKTGHKLLDMIKRYRTLSKRIDDHIAFKKSLLSVLYSFLIAVFLWAVPVGVLISMFIYTKLTILLCILLLMIAVLWVFTYYYCYYEMIQTSYPEIRDWNVKLVRYFESVIMSVILTFFVIVLFILFL